MMGLPIIASILLRQKPTVNFEVCPKCYRLYLDFPENVKEAKVQILAGEYTYEFQCVYTEEKGVCVSCGEKLVKAETSPKEGEKP